MAADPGAGEVTLRLAFSAVSAALVRDALQEWMTERGYSADDVEDARLVATELVGNAVRHAAPVSPDQLVVRWRREGQHLALAVTDGGSETVPRQRVASPEATGGRGLRIVDALAHRWWVERRGMHSTVHAVLPADGLLRVG